MGESLDNINLPDHVKFPATFREGARNLYVQTRDNKKLPKSIRIYRERVTKKYAQEIRENEMEIEEEKNSYENYLTQRRDSVSSRLDNNINNNTDTELEYDAVADQFIEDRSVDVLFRPYAMTFILVVLLGIFFTGMTKNSNNLELPTSELVDNSNLSYNPEFLPLYRSIHLGVISCCTIFILIGILMLPSGPFTRPHPIVWRVTLSLSILYLMALIFTFFLSVEQVQKVLVYLFGQNILETASEAQLKEEYATNCNEISLSKLYSALDRYVAAHFLGWVCKSILLRSYGICWLISVTWEITEISFTHIVQNLTECWWDSWILDVLIFNGLGIYIGIKIANYLEMRSYKWESIKILDNQQELQVQVNQKNTKKEKIKHKLKRVALQFTPKTWLKIRWINPKSSPYRVFQLWCLTMLFLITELNTFFFKHFVNYRSSHFLCWGRIIFICIMAAPSIRQFYIYVTDFRAKNLGSQCWLYVACITMETLINIKFGWTPFEKAQFKIIVNWMGIAALACAVCLYFMAAWSELTVYIFNDNNKNQLQNQNLETLKEESLNINSLSRKNSSN